MQETVPRIEKENCVRFSFVWRERERDTSFDLFPLHSSSSLPGCISLHDREGFLFHRFLRSLHWINHEEISFPVAPTNFNHGIKLSINWKDFKLAKISRRNFEKINITDEWLKINEIIVSSFANVNLKNKLFEMVKFFTFHYKSRRIRIDFYISHLCHCESLLTRRNLASTSTLLPFLPLVLSSHASKPPSSSDSPNVYNNFNRCTLCRALEFLPGNKAIKPFGTHVGHRNFVWPSEERLRSNGKQISAKFEFEGKGAPFPPFIKTPFSTLFVAENVFPYTCVAFYST